MSESIADSVNGTRMPILRSPSATGAGDGGAPAVQAVMARTRARSTGPSGPALLPRLLRCVDELVGVGLGQVDVRVLLDVLVELLEQAQLELRSARGHLPGGARSEEHTSELQSPDHLVCRLLLEKKKKKNENVHTT